MQKSKELTMKEAVDLMLKRYRLEKRATEEDIMHAWIKQMGSFVAGNTVKVELLKDTATIFLRSSVMKKEFSMQKEKITEMLNEELGAKILAHVEFK